MVDNIKAATQRNLTHIIGHDAAGKGGRQPSRRATDILFANPTNMNPFRRMAAKVVSNTARQKIGIYGDSTQVGDKAGTGASLTDGARALCPSAYMVKKLIAAGVPARCDAFLGPVSVSANTLAGYTAYNPDVVFGANWAFQSSAYTAGAAGIWKNVSNTDALVFTPQENADRFDIFYEAGSGFGEFTVTDASGTLATQATTGTSALLKVSVTRAVASKLPISIQRNGTGGEIRIAGADPWNSTKAELCILNAAVSGKSASSFAAAGSLAAITLFGCEGNYAELGLNDKNTGGATATAYPTNMQTVLTRCATVGAVAVGISQPGDAASAFNFDSDWINTIQGLAISNAAPLVDHNGRFVSRATDTSLYASGDAIHLVKAGYAIKGGLQTELFLG